MKILHKQAQHFVSLVILLAITFWLYNRYESFSAGSLLGRTTDIWFWLAAGMAILHQVYVWLAWRVQLGHQTWTRRLGLESGFRLYAVIFSVLILARPVLITAIAYSNSGLLAMPPAGLNLLAFLLLIPAAYLGYSVGKFFTVRRAFGIDHFDPLARQLPIENRGIFQFTRNGMYVFGFLILYLPGLLLASPASLLAAAFQHAYIWVHYLTVEKPDMDYIYANQGPAQ